MASIPSPRRSLPAATLLVTVVYAAAAVVAMALGGPAQRLTGLVVLAVTFLRLAALRGARKGAKSGS